MPILNNPDFSYRHPYYERMAHRWAQAWDFWRGGAFVLNPDHDVMTTRWSGGGQYSYLSADSGISPDRPGAWSAMDLAPTNGPGYLFQHSAETDEEYRARCARQVHLPIFQFMVNTYVAGIFKTGPTRGDGTYRPDARWREFWHDVDGVGTNIDAFVRQALALALVFGRAHCVTDRPLFDRPASSLAEQRERGERTTAYLLTPLQIVDWCVDRHGRFVWATILEDGDDSRTPGSRPGLPPPRYRTWWRDAWELWEADSDDESLQGYRFVANGPNPLGRVPISTLWAGRDNRAATMFCESPLADILDGDRHILNKVSELDEMERTQAFSILWLPEQDGVRLGPVDVRPCRALAGPSEAGPPQFVSPDPALAQNKWSRIESATNSFRQLSGGSRGKAEYSKEERSAAALSVESEDKRNQMATWAAAAEEFDRRLHEDVLSWDGNPGAPYPEPTYSRNFDARALSVKINDIVQLASTSALGGAALAELVKPVVKEMLTDSGSSSDHVADVMEMIDSQSDDAEASIDDLKLAVPETDDVA